MDHVLPSVDDAMKQQSFKRWQFLMPLVFIKILLGELKLVSYILQYFISRQLWLQIKASVYENDPYFTRMNLVCEVDQREGGIPTPSHCCPSPLTSPSEWFEGRRNYLLLLEGFQRTHCSHPLDLPWLLHGSPERTICYVQRSALKQNK